MQKGKNQKVKVRLVQKVVKVAKAAKSRAKRSYDAIIDVNGSFKDIMDAINGDTKNRIQSLIIMAVIVFVYVNADHTGFLWTWASDHPTNTLAAWITKNPDRFLAMICFVPTVVGAPSSSQAILAVLAAGGIMMMPVTELKVYAATAAAAHLYYKVKKPSTRWLIMAAVAAFWWFGYFTTTTDTTEAKLALLARQRAQQHNHPGSKT